MAVVIFAPIYVAAVVMWEGWALSWLWLWFFVPLGLPPLSLPHAVGVNIAAGLLTNQYIPRPDRDDWKAVAFPWVAGLMSLVAGWIAAQWL